MTVIAHTGGQDYQVAEFTSLTEVETFFKLNRRPHFFHAKNVETGRDALIPAVPYVFEELED